MKFFLKKLIKYSFIFFITITLLLSKVLAEPTTNEGNFSVTNENKTATGVGFNPSGTKMYVVGINGLGSNASIAQYSLSEPFNVSTSVLDQNIDISSKENKAQGIKFNADGTKVLVLGTQGDGVDVWDLTTPYDVTTLTVADTVFTSIGGNPRGFDFNNDGTKMFVLQLAELQEYSLSTPFDPSTKGTAKTLSITAISRSVNQGFAFNSDGKKMYVTRGKQQNSDSNSLNTITEYDLTESFNISSASSNGAYISSYTDHEQISGVTFSSTGSKLYYINFNAADEVRQFSLSCSYGVVTCMDPTSDKDDVASVQAQTAAAKEIMQHTTYPVLNRMEWLRRNKDNSNLTNQNVKLQFSNEILASLSNLIMPTSLTKNDTLAAVLQSGNWSTWSEGTISVGKVGDTLTSSAKNINSSAITFGADRRDSEERMYGVALRLGNDDIGFGNVKNSLDMNAVSLTLYESRLLGEGKFIDNLIGIGSFKTDIVNAVGLGSTNAKRDGKQIFTSSKIRQTFEKNKVNFTPNIKLDLGYTNLSDYEEEGSANLKFDDQYIGTIITSLGGAVDSSSNLKNGTFKPYFEFDYFADMSPSSEQKISYKSDASSTYTLTRINSSTHNLKSKLGFDYLTNEGWNITSNYQRTQSKGSGYSDGLFFGASYKSRRDTEYAMSLNENKAVLDYKKNINGFDVTVGSNYTLMSIIPDYGAHIEISGKF